MTTTTPTHCPYCALQCGMNLVNDNGLITVAPRPDFPTNKGGLCQKGWTSAELITHPDRLTTPLIRDYKGGKLREATWDEAFDLIVSGLLSVQERYGRDAVAFFGAGGLTNEKAYMLGKFARVALKTCNIDYNGRFCMSSAAAANIKAFGIDRGMPFPLEDIPKAEAILLVGSNCAETMPPIMQYFEEHRNQNGTLIVVDPRESATARAAALHLQLTPGSDAALANGLLHIAMADGLIDHDFIETRTSGFEDVRRVVASYWPDRVERMTGIPVHELTKAAHILGEASTAMVLSARGPEQQSSGVDNVLSYINLILALGHAGKAYSGYGCLTGQGNGQGGREHGQKADQLPGYRKIDNPQHRKEVAAVWGIDPDDLPGPGVSAVELLERLGRDNGPRAMLVFGSNLIVSAPNANEIKQRLMSLDLLVVSDIFAGETAQMADVVLPIAQWAEEEGTMTNLEGRVLRRRRAIEPPASVKTDAQILKILADRLGKGAHFTDKPEEIFSELRKASAGGVADYSGISYDRVEAEDGVFWPCPNDEHAGTPRLFLDRFGTPDGRARFHPIRHRGPAEVPDDTYPMYLTTGRVMAQYQSGAQTRRVRSLNTTSPEPFVEIHSSQAARLGIVEGDMVRVSSRRGMARVRARLTKAIRRDTIFIPFHWSGEGCANLLTNPALDPISKMPEYKVCAARIDKDRGECNEN